MRQRNGPAFAAMAMAMAVAAAVAVAVVCCASVASGEAVSPVRMRQYVQRQYYSVETYRSVDAAANSPAPFVDITTRAGVTASTVSGTDDGWQRVAIGSFVFPFWGHRHTEVDISANGFVSTVREYCRADGADAFCDWQVPDGTSFYRRYIAPLMSDWNPRAGAGADGGNEPLRVHFWEDIEHMRLYVQWTGVTLWSGDGDGDGDAAAYNATHSFTFQTVLLGDGSVQMNFKRVPFQPVAASVVRLRGESPRRYPQTIGLSNAFAFGDVMGQATGPEVDFASIVALATLPDAPQTAVAIGTDATNGGPGAPAGTQNGVSVLFRAVTPTCASPQLQANCSACVGFTAAQNPTDTNYLQCNWCYSASMCTR